MFAKSDTEHDYPIVETCIGGYPSRTDPTCEAYFELSCYGYSTVAFNHADRDDAVARLKNAERLADTDYNRHIEHHNGHPNDFDYQAVFASHASLIK